VGTPIGNLEDLSDRVRRVLSEVDRVAAEDTRTTGRLLKRLEISVPLISVFEGNEHARVTSLVEAMRLGESIALVSESGTPGISDPGLTLVQACVEAGIAVVPIPGPSAVVAVISACGLDAARFRFEGFLPRKGPDRRTRLQWLRRDPVPAVIYESPRRLVATLNELATILGPRPAVVAREVTKVHEDFVRGTLGELASRFERDPPRGEITLVVAGAPPAEEALDDEALDRAIRARLAEGQRTRDIARELAELTSCSRREIYARVTRLKGSG
jgi:16S rRNA (cytidine1402-2'-O)-methyltransferase